MKMMKKMAFAAGYACALAAGTAWGRNVVKNGDLSLTDGMGSVVGWMSGNYDESTVSARPVGGGVVSVEFYGAKRTYFKQSPLTLQPGGRYRISADVRTSGLGGAKVQCLLWDSGWHDDVGTPLFPDDTKGEWRTVEWSGKIMENRNPSGYTFALAGDGGTSGKVRVEVRNLSIEPLTPEADAAGTGYPDALLKPFVTRIVPIDPLLSRVSAATGEIAFYWPGVPSCGVEACTLFATVDGGRGQTAKLGADGRAKVAFGRLSAGAHRVAVHVKSPDGIVLAENSYRITARKKLPAGPSGKRLNNFVTELVNQPLADGEVRFFRPEDGWVWISLEEAGDGACGWVDGCAVPAVRRRCKERYTEAVRDVAAGWHTLKVAGAKGGRLRIHAIKNVSMSLWPLRSGPCDFSFARYQFSFDFARRFLLPSLNTVNNAEQYLRNPRGEEAGYYKERGFGIWGGTDIQTTSIVWIMADEQLKQLTGSSWRNGFDISVDESVINGQRLQHVTFAENVWKMFEERPAQRVNIFWGDATEHWYDDPRVHASELVAVANTGNGRGVSLPEVYTPVLRTAEETDKWLDLYAQQVKAIGEMAPAAKDMTVFNVSPWINLGHWSDYSCPEGDIKALFARNIHAFATRPEFAANSGIAAGASGAAEEEIRRWTARLFRYYAIEGGTENLAERYGYRWAPGFVRNCDFDDGLEGWTASPSDGGDVKTMKIEKYGTRIQCRKKVPVGTGDNVAVFTSSKCGANRLSQRLSGLEPGKLYALMFCAPNLANVETASLKPMPLAFSAHMEGAEELEGLRFRHIVQCKRIPKGSAPGAKLHLAIYRYVFKAASSEATLVFEDRGHDGEALEPGSRQILNYVIFRPYYTETPEEAQEIADIIAGK